ncbi:MULTISPECIES: Mov34/MPN/PAD-1 family protein [Stenotrophomonas]|uniref:Mov34/MPN/PAD-1 family protein n=1 Tax=Stenotrophomonas TaxID=40323 RepID=UPI0009F6796A|nr:MULTISPECIES: Mov34/MPN/PAD-1 family protein [Stenotrophomonas]
MNDYFEWGEPVAQAEASVESQRFLELLEACRNHSDIKFLELRRGKDPKSLGIVVDVGDGSVAPGNPVGIRPRERLWLGFDQSGKRPPEVRALRRDFPNLLHLNAVPTNEPASLCLYENWTFEERQWTAQRHLRRILWWLRESAKGSLHATDQPLEPLFYGTGYTVVLPASFQAQTADDLGAIRLSVLERNRLGLCLVASDSLNATSQMAIQPLLVNLSPVEHVPIQRPPSDLGGLDEALYSLGVSIIEPLRESLCRQFRSNSAAGRPSGKVLLILRLPRLRGSQVERIDTCAFLTSIDINRLGLQIGSLFQPNPGGAPFAVDPLLGSTAGAPDDRWKAVEIVLTEIKTIPVRSEARKLSGISASEGDFSAVLAGVGALGSGLVDTWVREGWGRWTCIDPDYVEPHNLIRHIATSKSIGHAKAVSVCAQLGLVFGTEEATPSPIVAEASDWSDPAVTAALAGADLLVDASTTINVPRDWSERELPRSASVFFTHNGLSAVMLLEDAERTIRLASIEAQYYRAVINEEWGAAHLRQGDQVRVGRGCRDHSIQLPADLAKLHSAQLARRVRMGVVDVDACAQIWTLNDSTGAISTDFIKLRKSKLVQRGDWSVRWDEGLEDRLRLIRSEQLPNETGGILVGVVDQVLRTLTLVDASAAPADSVADTVSFVRGKEGGQAYVDRCEALTAGMVSYVGEWHAHPEGCSASPSATDVVLLSTLAERLAADGVPALMVIVSSNAISISLGQTVAAMSK